MKRNLLKALLLVLLILNQENCYSQITQLEEDKLITRFDEFKKINTTLLKINCPSVEAKKGLWGNNPNYILKANIFRSPLSDSVITFSFSFVIRDMYEPLDSIAYLNINDSIYPIEVRYITKNLVSNIDAITTGVGSSERVTDIRTDHYIIYNGKIYLPGSLYDPIRPTSKFILRMYLDYETVTFRFLPSEMDLLYQFIQAK